MNFYQERKIDDDFQEKDSNEIIINQLEKDDEMKEKLFTFQE